MFRRNVAVIVMMLALGVSCDKDSKPAAKQDLVIQYYALPG